jgi:hypothetical protein
MAKMLSTEHPIPNHTICIHSPRLVIARRDAVPTRQSSRTMGSAHNAPDEIARTLREYQ